MYVLTHNLCHKQDLKQGQFLGRVWLVLNIVFILLKSLPNQGKRTQHAQLLTHSWRREKRWIHAFLKSVNTKLNTNSHIQGLNFIHRFHIR